MQISTKKTLRKEETWGVNPLQAAAFWSVNRHEPAYDALIAFHAKRCLLEEGVGIEGKGIAALVKMTNKRLDMMENGRGNYTRIHSREVATLACTVFAEANKRGHPEAMDTDLRYIFAGGFTHDVGKTMLPNALMFKETGVRIGGLLFSRGKKMTEVERGTLQDHVVLSSACARLCWDANEKAGWDIVSDMIGLHHAMYDGLDTAYPSYPVGRRGRDLSLYARIAKTADFLSAVLPREYRPVYQQQWIEKLEQAIAYAITVAGTELDPFAISCLLTGVYEVSPRRADELVRTLRYPGDRKDLLDLERVKEYVMHVVEKKPEFAEMIAARCAKRIAQYVDIICTCAESFGVEIAPKFPV